MKTQIRGSDFELEKSYRFEVGAEGPSVINSMASTQGEIVPYMFTMRVIDDETGKPVSMKPRVRESIITGQKGIGKSTMVDALANMVKLSISRNTKARQVDQPYRFNADDAELLCIVNDTPGHMVGSLPKWARIAGMSYGQILENAFVKKDERWGDEFLGEGGMVGFRTTIDESDLKRVFGKGADATVFYGGSFAPGNLRGDAARKEFEERGRLTGATAASQAKIYSQLRVEAGGKKPFADVMLDGDAVVTYLTKTDLEKSSLERNTFFEVVNDGLKHHGSEDVSVVGSLETGSMNYLLVYPALGKIDEVGHIITGETHLPTPSRPQYSADFYCVENGKMKRYRGYRNGGLEELPLDIDVSGVDMEVERAQLDLRGMYTEVLGGQFEEHGRDGDVINQTSIDEVFQSLVGMMVLSTDGELTAAATKHVRPIFGDYGSDGESYEVEGLW